MRHLTALRLLVFGALGVLLYVAHFAFIRLPWRCCSLWFYPVRLKHFTNAACPEVWARWYSWPSRSA
ncbi:MAG: hypothetical protein WDM77_22225 [Steroidobacteraceae bacterium]